MMLQLSFGDTDVSVSTTSTLSRLIAATHRRYERNSVQPGRKNMRHSIVVEIAPPARSPEFALREAKREIAAEVAAVNGWHAVHAVVVARDGRALALVGLAASGRSTIAAHLISRGWRLVADDIAFIDTECALVMPHHGLMSFRSGAIPHLPGTFRGTLERSRWFVEADGELAFYEVDPAGVFGADVWSGEAVLDAIIVVDDGNGGRGVEFLSRDELVMRAIDGQTVSLDAFANLRVGIIKRERTKYTADHIERWYDAHAGT